MYQLKTLQHRIVGGGVKIGSKVFQSFEDVQWWVKSNLPICRYGLFVYAVSILDFSPALARVIPKTKCQPYIMQARLDLLPFMNPESLPLFKTFSQKCLVRGTPTSTFQKFDNWTSGMMGPMVSCTKSHAA
jgi:hypothetical protein